MAARLTDASQDLLHHVRHLEIAGRRNVASLLRGLYDKHPNRIRVLFRGGEKLADEGLADPFWVMWTPNIVFFTIGCLMVSRMGRWVAASRAGGWQDIWIGIGNMLKAPFRRRKRARAIAICPFRTRVYLSRISSVGVPIATLKLSTGTTSIKGSTRKSTSRSKLSLTSD